MAKDCRILKVRMMMMMFILLMKTRIESSRENSFVFFPLSTRITTEIFTTSIITISYYLHNITSRFKIDMYGLVSSMKRIILNNNNDEYFGDSYSYTTIFSTVIFCSPECVYFFQIIYLIQTSKVCNISNRVGYISYSTAANIK